MSRLCRLKTKSHGDDGKWAYNEIVSLRMQRDGLLSALEAIANETADAIAKYCSHQGHYCLSAEIESGEWKDFKK